jgi:hypothetical protein
MLYEIFIKKNPDINDQVMKYDFFYWYFKQAFSLSFGRLLVDVFSTGELLKTKISDPNLNENAKHVAAAYLVVHKGRAKST